MLIDWPPARLRLEKSYIRGDADHAENSTGSHFPDLPPAFQIDQVSKEMYMKTSCKVIIINWLNWVNVDWFIFTVWPHRVLRLYILLREMIYYLYIVRRLWLDGLVIVTTLVWTMEYCIIAWVQCLNWPRWDQRTSSAKERSPSRCWQDLELSRPTMLDAVLFSTATSHRRL